MHHNIPLPRMIINRVTYDDLYMRVDHHKGVWYVQPFSTGRKITRAARDHLLKLEFWKQAAVAEAMAEQAQPGRREMGS